MAPAGGPEAGYAAIQAGADAVYLGLNRFSARAEAVNFGPEELADFAGYAHQLGRRVYATVNTLIKTRELPELLESLAVLSECRIDALIVQDYGVLRLLREYFPHLRLHASTQMAVHNRSGAELLRELGARRVTLARELTLADIAEISTLPELETESFLHGTLCYSYSGLCFFSALQRNGRSANRGRCAYPCRDLFTRIHSREVGLPDWDSGCAEESEEDEAAETKFSQGHIFSLKDLALPAHLQALAATGVSSLKIEGRKKSPLYVSTVVSMYRRLLDGGGLDDEYERDCQQVKTVFSRPWTNFFVGGEGKRAAIDAEVVGHRGAPIGDVERVRTDDGRRFLRFMTALSLERHDGLQMDLPGQSRPYGFGVSDLYVTDGLRTSRVFAAPAGARVEVVLPDDAPFIAPGTVLYRSSSQELKRETEIVIPKPGSCRPKRPVLVTLDVRPDRICATATVAAEPAYAGGREVPSVSVDLTGEWTPARQAQSGEAAARQVFDKTGDTSFALGEFRYHNPQDLFAPVSRLNALRRDLYAQLEEICATARADWLAGLSAGVLPAEAREPEKASGLSAATAIAAQDGSRQLLWSVKAEDPRLFEGWPDETLAGLEEIVLSLRSSADLSPEEWEAAAGRLMRRVKRIRWSVPVILRAQEEAQMRERLGQILQRGDRSYEVGNPSGWGLLSGLSGGQRLDLRADWSMYALNPQAVRYFNEKGFDGVCFSPEDDGENMRSLLHSLGCIPGAETDSRAGTLAERITLVAYQDVPLFTGEACARAALIGCRGDGRECEKQPLLVQDSFGGRYQLLSRGCRTLLVSTRPLYLGAHLPELVALGLRRARVDFLHRPYRPEEACGIWKEIQVGNPLPQTREGNYAGTLL